MLRFHDVHIKNREGNPACIYALDDMFTINTRLILKPGGLGLIRQILDTARLMTSVIFLRYTSVSFVFFKATSADKQVSTQRVSGPAGETCFFQVRQELNHRHTTDKEEKKKNSYASKFG